MKNVEAEGVARFRIFFNENANSKIFFFTILDIRIYGELYGKEANNVFPDDPFDAQRLNIYLCL